MTAAAEAAPLLDEALERDIHAVATLLAEGKRFLLAGHRNPDGDSLGSALALARALRREGKEARVLARDPWSTNYSWLPEIETVTLTDALPADWPAGWDGLIALECPSASRLGFERLSEGRVVNVDHHPGNARYGALNLVDVKAAAAGEVVADLLDLLEWPIDAAMATDLWVSLVSDTGSFRYSNTSAKALALAARLVAAGAKPGDVNERLYESRPARAVRLEALVLGTLQLHADGRVATLELPERFLAETGAEGGDAEGLVNRARGIEGVRAAALLSERADGISCSLRSKSGVDVRAVAARFGGGGHENAAGCTLPGALPEVKALLVRELAAAAGGAA